MRFDFATGAVMLMALAAVVLQVLATVRVKGDSGSSPEQKRLQFRLIWLLPLIGAALVLAVLHEEPSRGSKSAKQGAPAAADVTRPKRPSSGV